MKAIKTTYLGPTDTRGARVKASDCDRNSIVLNWDHALDSDDNHKAAAKALCEKMNWKGKLIMGGFPDCNVHVFATRDFTKKFIVNAEVRKQGAIGRFEAQSFCVSAYTEEEVVPNAIKMINLLGLELLGINTIKEA